MAQADKKKEPADDVTVTSRIPVALLLDGDSAELRQMLGEEVYRQALLKMAPPDGERRGKMLDA